VDLQHSFVTKSSGTWGKADKDLAQKVRASESIEESRQLKDKETEMMVVKDGKVIVIDKSDFDKYKSKGYIQAEDKEEENEACWDSHKQVGTKMKGGKRVPNCVPKNEEIDLDEKAKELYMFSTKKDAEKKAKEIGGKVVTGTGKSKGYFAAMKEELELEANFSPDMINKMKKAYEPLRGKRIAPEPLMKIFDKIDKNKNALIQLFKADIPFVSQLAVSRLISKHNMKGAEINKLREETEEVTEKYTSMGSGKLTPAQKKFQAVLQRATKDKEATKAAYLKTKKEEKEVKEELTPAQKKFQALLKKSDKDRQSKKATYLKTKHNLFRLKKVKEEVQEADLTDKQVDMVKKVADKLPKDDFKKRYGKDADNVKFGTATNIVKKKLNIDGYDGARNLVDRLLNKEKGDE